jgi:hypothetical protein
MMTEDRESARHLHWEGSQVEGGGGLGGGGPVGRGDGRGHGGACHKRREGEDEALPQDETFVS